MYNYNYLIHYGIPRHSGRYPWGSGKRPYQDDNIAFKNKKSRSLSEEEYENKKQEVLKYGTARDVLKFKGDLSTQEMLDAVNRIRLERRLKDISIEEKNEGWSAVNRAMSKVKDVKEWAKTSVDLYNEGERAVETGEKIFTSIEKLASKYI